MNMTQQATLEQLKAQAYDLMAQMQYTQNVLQAINEAINKKLREQQKEAMVGTSNAEQAKELGAAVTTEALNQAASEQI